MYGNAVYTSYEDVESVVTSASKHSVYAYTDELARGYITCQGGVRVGICGEVVTENNKIDTIKNYSSVCLRLPHEVKGCANGIMKDAEVARSMLILSPPASGKTTLLRDIARQLSSNAQINNVLIVDERDEIACISDGQPTMDVGITTVVLSGGNKKHSFESAIRSVRPDVIITDELFNIDRSEEHTSELQ